MPEQAVSDLVVAHRTVLVLVELQNGVVGRHAALPELARAAQRAGVVENATRLAALARRAGVRVVHATAENLAGGFGANHNARLFAGARGAGVGLAPGSDPVRPLPELGPEDGDVVLPRYHGLSPLTGGPLDSLLRNAGIDAMVVAGVSLNLAVPNLVFDAVNRAYQVVVVSDAVVGVPEEYGLRVLEHTLALVATLVTTEELARVWSPGG